MIKLFETDKTEERQSSKGNQLKFCRDNIWYKADYTGYEGLVEYTVSKLLVLSSLNKDEFIEYYLEQIEYNDQYFNACASNDFTDGWQLITLERLFKQCLGVGFNKIVYSIDNHTDRLRTLVDTVERLTGLKDFGIYMNKTLTIDALFLNEDRHAHNLAVLTKNMKEYKLSPIFDNGAGLLSDITMDYPLGKDYIKLIDKVEAKTFCDDLEEQMEISEALYGENIHFTFGYNDVKKIVDAADNYSEEIRTRVIETVMQMRRRYSYLFK